MKRTFGIFRRAGFLTLALMVAACAPRLQPAGAGGEREALLAQSWRADDGRELPLRRWPPEGAPRAVILALHGFNDYGTAFNDAAEWWASRHQLATFAPDQRGFGAGPYRGLWAGRDRLAADLLQQTALLRASYPGRPVFWLGESMGGAVALHALPQAEGVSRPDGIILSAPAVWGRASMPWYYSAALGLLSHTFPWAEVTGRGLGIQASDNIPMLRRLGADPLVIKSTRIDAIHGLVGLMDAAAEFPQRRPAAGLPPVLLLYGLRDEVIPKAPVERFAAALGPEVRIAAYQNGWHMLLRDLSAEIVWADIAAWIADPKAPLPSAAERHTLPLFDTVRR